MSNIFNDQLTDNSTSSIFHSTCHAGNSDSIVHNAAYNSDTQGVENNLVSSAIKVTENFESLEHYQLSQDTFQQQNRIQQKEDQILSPEPEIGSSSIKSQHQKQNKNLEINSTKDFNMIDMENRSNKSGDSQKDQQQQNIISDSDSEFMYDYKNTKDLSNQRYETFPEEDILDGQYERLDLSRNELSRMNKPIPNGVKELILNENRFAFLTNLKGEQLTFIEIKNNRLISVSGIKSCICLKYLDISNNFLSDDQLDDLTQLKELEILLIKHNHLKSQSIIDQFSSNKKLKLLDLSQNDIEDIMIAQNCYVEKLILLQNKIDSFKILPTITNQKSSMPKIYTKKIDISSNGLQYFDAKQLSQIKELNLQDNQLLDLDLSNNFNLKKINLNKNSLSYIKFNEGKIYPLIKSLLISSNRLVKISFVSQHLHCLEELDVSNNNIDDHKHFFDHISKLQKLMKLNMEDNPFDNEAKKIQRQLELKGQAYLKQNGLTQSKQYEDEQKNMNSINTKDEENIEEYRFKEQCKILNSHFSSISNGQNMMIYQSQDNNSNLLNCQLSPDLFQSIDQQYITQKSEAQQSIDQSVLFKKKKNQIQQNTDFLISQQKDSLNNSITSENQSFMNANKIKFQTSIIDETNEEYLKESSNQSTQRNKSQIGLTNQLFESNLFKKKNNQNEEEENFESEAKILNDQLNFSISEEDDISSKRILSKRNDNIFSNNLNSEESLELKNRSFLKKGMNQQNANIPNQQNNKQKPKQSVKNNNKYEDAQIKQNKNFSKVNENSKENQKITSNQTFNDLDEEEKQLKLAIETMESSLTEGSLLSEITNEMTKEYKKNLNQLKEYYKDRKGQQTIRKEDGEALLQINQILMQKIIFKLGDDPSLQKNPYFLKCKQLIQSSYETFEPTQKQQRKEFFKENDQNANNIQLKKESSSKKNEQYQITKNSFQIDYSGSISSPQFQKVIIFNETISQREKDNAFQFHTQKQYKVQNGKELQYSHNDKQQQKNGKINKQSMNLNDPSYESLEKYNIQLQQDKIGSQSLNKTNAFEQDYECNQESSIPDFDIDMKTLNRQYFQQGSQNSSFSIPNQMNSFMSTQEQNGTQYINNQQKYKNNIKHQQTQNSLPFYTQSNSNNSMNNNKTLNLFDTSTNNVELSCLYSANYPLFTDASQINMIGQSSPLKRNENKHLNSQSSYLPTQDFDYFLNHPQNQQQESSIRAISKDQIQQQNNIKKQSQTIQQTTLNTFNNEYQLINEEEFYSVFKEYLIQQDSNRDKQYNKNHQNLTVRKKFIKLIIREVLSNCDLFYNTQSIDQILKNILPVIEDQENVRFDTLYNLLIKNIQNIGSLGENSKTTPLCSDSSPKQNKQTSISSNFNLNRREKFTHETQQSAFDNYIQEEKLKTPPQMITFRSKLRESTQENKLSTRQSYQQSLSSNARFGNERMPSNRTIQQLNDKENYNYHQISPIFNKQTQQNCIQNNNDNYQNISNNQQIINMIDDNSFLSTIQKRSTQTQNDKSNASFELFLIQQQQKTHPNQRKQNISISKPKQFNQRDEFTLISLSYEDFYSQVTPYIKFIIQKSSVSQLQRQSSRDQFSASTPVSQVDYLSDEFKAVGLFLSQIKLDIHRVAKSTNKQAQQILHAKYQQILKQSLQVLNLQNLNDRLQDNIIAHYLNESSLFFNNYLVLFHAAELSTLGKVLETSFLQFYGQFPTIFSLKRNIAELEQEKYIKKKRFNIQSQNQTNTNTSMQDGQKQKWRILLSKVYLGKCLIDQTNTLESFDLNKSLEFIIEQLFNNQQYFQYQQNYLKLNREGYQSVFFEKSDAYMLFENSLATPLYLCEYYNNYN